MVKKRQPDLDSSTTLALKSKGSVTSLRQSNKVAKNKNKNPRSEAFLLSTARELLFGGKKLKDVPSIRADLKQKTSHGNKLKEKDSPIKFSQNAQQMPTLDKELIVCLENNVSIKNVPDIVTARQISIPVEKVKIRTKPKIKAFKSKKLRLINPPKEKSVGNGVITAEEPLDISIKIDKTEASQPFKSTGTSTKPRTSAYLQNALKELSLASSLSKRLEDSEFAADNDDAEHFQQICTLHDEESWLIAFSHRIELRGFAKIEQVQGSVMVHGYLLAKSEVIDSFAPSGYFNTVVENANPTFFEGLDNIGCYKNQMSLKTYDNLCQFLSKHPHSAVICVHVLEVPRLQICASMLPEQNIPSGFVHLGSSIAVSQCHLKPRYNFTVLQAVEYLVECSQKGQNPRILVCGSKDIGKSTLIRFIVNRLLASAPAVSYLDCDPGQSEFSPPGCLSLHAVKSPLIGPPWCRLPEQVDRVQLYGANNADHDPDKYLNCLSKLVDLYKSSHGNQPLVVNTMGWKQGLGLQFLAATVVKVSPTHLIQLGVAEDSYRNFPLFTVFNLGSHDLFISEQVPNLHQQLQYEVMPLLMDHVADLVYKTDLLKPLQSRDLATTAYISSNAKADINSIHEIPPYAINMCDVAVDIGDSSLPPHLIPAVINMQVLALCSVDPHLIAKVNDGEFMRVLNRHNYNVVGFGLVRAIDVETRRLYVTTPLTESKLSQVNVLVKFHSPLNADVWYNHQLAQVADGRQLPYLGIKKTGIGQNAVGEMLQKFKRRRSTMQI